MIYHTLKIKEHWFRRIMKEDKTVEIRKNDRDFQTDDELYFTVIDEKGLVIKESDQMFKITHVLEFPEGLKKGYVALSISKDNV